MAKVISQETFDDVVKENIIEFSMDVNEAKEETIKQFEAQGINLANIIKDLTINEDTGRPVLSETIDRLKEISLETSLCNVDVTKLFEVLAAECVKSVPHRVMAAKLGAHEIVLDILKMALTKCENVDAPVIKKALVAWNELVNKQPDIFDDKSLFIVISLLDKKPSDEVILSILHLLKHATLLHEINRQNIMNAEILPCLRPLLKSENIEVLKETCTVFRHLILDDDIRVEFSKAHDHARAIASEVLVELTELLPVHIKNRNMLSDLFLTIATLSVRQEFCVQVDEAGGLKFIFDGMTEHAESMRVSKDALKLLRALAGNDTVKKNILQGSAAKQINDVINMHKSNEVFARAALMCLSTVTLRSVENSQALFDVGGAETIVETMRLHPNSMIVQRNGAWAIRNMVSRSRDQCPTFLSHGAEDILAEAMEKYPDVAYDIKSALRDLGCKVMLKEEWTGVKNKINIQC